MAVLLYLLYIKPNLEKVLLQDQKNLISIQILFIEIKEFLYHIKMNMKIFLVIKLLKTVKFVMMIILMVLMIVYHVNMISNLIDKHVSGQFIFCEDGFLFDQIICSVIMESLMMVTKYHTIPYDGSYECKIAIIISKLFIRVCTLLSKMCISDYRVYLKECQRKLIYIQIDHFQFQSGWYWNEVEYICEIGQEQYEISLSYQIDYPYNWDTNSFDICQQCQRGFYLLENECYAIKIVIFVNLINVYLALMDFNYIDEDGLF